MHECVWCGPWFMQKTSTTCDGAMTWLRLLCLSLGGTRIIGTCGQVGRWAVLIPHLGWLGFGLVCFLIWLLMDMTLDQVRACSKGVLLSNKKYTVRQCEHHKCTLPWRTPTLLI